MGNQILYGIIFYRIHTCRVHSHLVYRQFDLSSHNKAESLHEIVWGSWLETILR